MLLRSLSRSFARFSSSKARRDITTFLRSSLIFIILKSKFLPIKSSSEATGLISSCEAGKNASTPISTIKPPLTFLNIFPSIRAPSEHFWIVRSHFLLLSTFNLDKRVSPSSSSIVSKNASTLSPME